MRFTIMAILCLGCSEQVLVADAADAGGDSDGYVEVQDGGVVMLDDAGSDAGASSPDAGEGPEDAGAVEPDSGDVPDAGPSLDGGSDAGLAPDAGEEPDAGPAPPPTAPVGRAHVLSDLSRCALDDGGHVWCWGRWDRFDPHTVTRSSELRYIASEAVDIGGECFLDAAGDVRCVTFFGVSPDVTFEVRAVAVTAAIDELAPGSKHTYGCGLSGVTLWCWVDGVAYRPFQDQSVLMAYSHDSETLPKVCVVINRPVAGQSVMCMAYDTLVRDRHITAADVDAWRLGRIGGVMPLHLATVRGGGPALDGDPCIAEASGVRCYTETWTAPHNPAEYILHGNAACWVNPGGTTPGLTVCHKRGLTGTTTLGTVGVVEQQVFGQTHNEVCRSETTTAGAWQLRCYRRFGTATATWYAVAW